MSFFGNRTAAAGSSGERLEQIKAEVANNLALAQAQELVNTLNAVCFKTCVKPADKLSSGEERCLSNCMDRFLEAFSAVSTSTMRRIQLECVSTMRRADAQTTISSKQSRLRGAHMRPPCNTDERLSQSERLHRILKRRSRSVACGFRVCVSMSDVEEADVVSLPDSTAPDGEDDVEADSYWRALSPVPNRRIGSVPAREQPAPIVEAAEVNISGRPSSADAMQQPIASTSRPQPAAGPSSNRISSPTRAPASPPAHLPGSTSRIPAISSSPDSQPMRTSSARKGKGRAIVQDDEDDSLPSGTSPRPAARSPTAQQRPSPVAAALPALDGAEDYFVAGRPLRKRKQAQLNPFSHERAKYLGTLVRNNWQDAVVIEKARREETDAERRQKRAKLAQRGADDLDGWLDLEGRPIRIVEDEEDTHAAQLDRDDLELIGVRRPGRPEAVSSRSRAEGSRIEPAVRSRPQTVKSGSTARSKASHDARRLNRPPAEGPRAI